jgi:hypothetical protein
MRSRFVCFLLTLVHFALVVICVRTSFSAQAPHGLAVFFASLAVANAVGVALNVSRIMG